MDSDLLGIVKSVGPPVFPGNSFENCVNTTLRPDFSTPCEDDKGFDQSVATRNRGRPALRW
jgi:hypothetical protein